MAKHSFTLIVVPNSSSRLHKIRIQLSALYLAGLLALTITTGAAGLSLGYARMALKTADYNELQSENTTLKVENKNLEVATRQLNTKIESLEDLSYKIQEMMETDTWNNRLGLVGEGGIGGTLEDYPTATMLASLAARDTIEVARNLTFELEDHLLVAEQIAMERAGKLLRTPSLWPVSGPVRSGYGRRRDPFTGAFETHLGIDIGALYGTTVRAAANGRVLFARREGSYGNLIVLDHGGGITSRYGHLSRYAVQVGDQLQRGEVVGYVGSTGRSTGPHLHYEVRFEDRPVNPRNYLPVDMSSAD